MNKTKFRPTWAEIDLSAVRHNLEAVKRFVKGDVTVMPVVKANAYGHGIVEVSRALAECGIDRFGVATVDEALTLRDAGINASILVLGSMLEEELSAAVEKDVTVTLCDERLEKALYGIAERTGKRPRVHIKVDTGMGRIGIWHEEAAPFIERVFNSGRIEVEGVYTHFSTAGRDRLYTDLQIDHFTSVLKKLEEKNIHIKYRHSANSIAVIDWEKAHLNLIRPGIMLYGIYPKESFRRLLDLKPVMQLKTKIVFVKDTPPGRSISYGRTFITQEGTRIATIPIGYADGYGRILSNRAEALVNGKHVRIVGMVTMDQTLLDLGEAIDAKVGDEVVLIGEQNGQFLNAEKVARLAKTIPYEILAGITDRVPRIYRG